MEEKLIKNKRGNLILENRAKLTVSGINDVESFDEGRIILITDDGSLTVTGNNMHIKKLSAETGDAIIEGAINGCVYTDGRREKESFLKRVLR